jgi:hypothetical protein
MLWSIISGNTLEVNEQITHRYCRIRAGSISVIKKIIDNYSQVERGCNG